MRTQEEIVTRMEAKREQDYFGFEVTCYYDWLDWEHAKKYMKPSAKKGWAKSQRSNTKRNILAKMKSYMDFAWDKANGCRGLSADRSIGHYVAWIWLLGDDDFLNKLDEIEYEHYGKEKLIAICEQYGWDWKKRDDGNRTNYG